MGLHFKAGAGRRAGCRVGPGGAEEGVVGLEPGGPGARGLVALACMTPALRYSALDVKMSAKTTLKQTASKQTTSKQTTS